MNYKLIITIILLSIFATVSFYINSIEGVLNLAISLGIYTILFYILHILWRKLRKKEIIESEEYIKSFLFRISVFMLVLVSTLGILAFLSNEIYPAQMPEYTLTNGEKIVKFQGMVHIGSQDYYNSVLNNLTNFKKEGGVHFFEGVRPGSQENMESFDEALGITFSEDLYKNFSKLYGVTFQDYSMFLGVENDLDFNVDLDIDTIMELYREKNIEYGIEKEYSTPINADEKILETLSTLNEKELKILVYVNQAILNLLIGSDSLQKTLSNSFTNKELFNIIIGERDKYLSKAVYESEYEKIYITYGLLHFNGFLKELQKLDPSWEIIETKYLYPIK